MLSEIRPTLYNPTVEKWSAGDVDVAWPEGESLNDVAARGMAGLKEIGLLGGPAANRCPRYVLIAAHGRFNKILIASLQGDRAKCSEIAQGNTCINVIDLAPDGACTVQVLNLRDHLVGMPAQKTLAPV